MSTNPILLHEVVCELARVRCEVEGMVIGLKGRRPQGETLERALYLQARFRALKITLRSFESEAMAYEIAFRERTNRNFDESADEFTDADLARGQEILRIFGIRQDGVKF